MRLVLQQREHVRCVVVLKGVQIEAMFFEAASVYRFQRLHAVDADFVGCESDHGAVLLVQSQEGADAGADAAFLQDPEWKNGVADVAIGDLLYGAEEGG